MLSTQLIVQVYMLQLPAHSSLVDTINYQWPFFHLFASNFHSCKEHHLIKHHNRGLLRREWGVLHDITRIYSGKIWGKEQPGDRGEETSEIYERLAELAIEIGRVTGAVSNFAIFEMENPMITIC